MFNVNSVSSLQATQEKITAQWRFLSQYIIITGCVCHALLVSQGDALTKSVIKSNRGI